MAPKLVDNRGGMQTKKMCKKCEEEFSGFGDTCSKCRKVNLKSTGTSQACSVCGDYFSGWGTKCQDCKKKGGAAVDFGTKGEFKVGEVVYTQTEEGQWWVGQIVKLNWDGSYTLSGGLSRKGNELKKVSKVSQDMYVGLEVRIKGTNNPDLNGEQAVIEKVDKLKNMMTVRFKTGMKTGMLEEVPIDNVDLLMIGNGGEFQQQQQAEGQIMVYDGPPPVEAIDAQGYMSMMETPLENVDVAGSMYAAPEGEEMMVPPPPGQGGDENAENLGEDQTTDATIIGSDGMALALMQGDAEGEFKKKKNLDKSKSKTVTERYNTLQGSPPDAEFKVCVVEFKVPDAKNGGTDKGPNGNRIDSIPIANGVINAGGGCDILQYSHDLHDNFVDQIKDYDAFIVRINAGELSQGTSEGTQDRFDKLMKEKIADGKLVWSSPDVQAKMGAKDALDKISQSPIDLSDAGITEGNVEVLMVLDRVQTIIHKKPAGEDGNVDCTYYAKTDEKVAGLGNCMAKLIDTMDIVKELPMLWSAEFVPNQQATLERSASGKTAASAATKAAEDGAGKDAEDGAGKKTEYIIGQCNCSCAGILKFQTICDGEKTLADVSDEDYWDAVKITDFMGDMVVEMLSANQQATLERAPSVKTAASAKTEKTIATEKAKAPAPPPEEDKVPELPSAKKAMEVKNDAPFDLKVIIVGAKNLRNADWAPGQGVSDPYCVCQIVGQPDTKLRTKMIKNNLNPVWNHLCLFADYKRDAKLKFEVWDKDPMKKDDFLGTCTVDPKLFLQFYAGGIQGHIKLENTGNKKQKEKDSFLVLKIVKVAAI